jgi:hypothetical protein
MGKRQSQNLQVTEILKDILECKIMMHISCFVQEYYDKGEEGMRIVLVIREFSVQA